MPATSSRAPRGPLDGVRHVQVAANLGYVVYDAPWFRSLGDVVTTTVGLAATVRLWQVFPFDFTGSFDWPLVVRVLLVVAVVGSVLGLLVNLAGLARRTVHHSPAR